jgi:hypothetical protein
VWLGYFVNDFNMVPFATVVLVTLMFFTAYMCCTSSLRSLFFWNLFSYSLITFLFL